MKERVQLEDRMVGGIERGASLKDSFKPGGHPRIWCVDPEGNLKWEDEGPNLVTNEGEAHYLEVAIANGTQVTAWNIGLFGSVTAAAGTLAEGDTLGSWGTGISELTAYSEGNRVTYVESAVQTGATPSVHNTASPASFSITVTGTGTVGGAFVASTATKGGTAGVLMAERAFSGGDRTVQSGDTVNIEYTLTMGGS